MINVVRQRLCFVVGVLTHHQIENNSLAKQVLQVLQLQLQQQYTGLHAPHIFILFFLNYHNAG